MEPMTLREAARRTSRSITTLRRYIRSGRLQAEKRQGQFGPEYLVHEHQLAGAGLSPDPPENSSALAPRGGSRSETGVLDLREAERILSGADDLPN